MSALITWLAFVASEPWGMLSIVVLPTLVARLPLISELARRLCRESRYC